MIGRRLQSNSGVAVVLIVALIAAIVFALWSWTAKAKAEKCLSTITGDIATYNQQYRNSIQAGNPDSGICRQLNVLIGKYNTSCGKDYGNIPLEVCG